MNNLGQTAVQYWSDIPQYHDNTEIDEFVIMPNHLHGILVITERMTNVETPRRGVSTRSKWKPGTLGAIINQFKSISPKRIRRAGTPAFAWQPRFYDHIIRNEDALSRIRTYIQNNPQKWENDKYFC